MAHEPSGDITTDRPAGCGHHEDRRTTEVVRFSAKLVKPVVHADIKKPLSESLAERDG
jgi:hypothetical protein